ncbi:Ral guanine nucleotide dissociation stimulator [Vulpes lagopus]
MFSCCLPTSGGSGSQEPRGGRLFQCCRLWLQHKNQRLRTVIRRRRQSSTRDMGHAWEEGVVCPTASKSREVPCAANRGQRGLKGAGASAGKGCPICPTKPSRTELLEHEDRQLQFALQHRDVISICSFLDDYRGFTTTDEVLDLLFTEYGCIVAACADNDAVLQRWKLAISCMLEIWLDYYRDDFCQLPEFPSLMKLLQFLRQHMPGSDVELRAQNYLQQFRCLHAAEPEAGASAQGKHPEAEECAPAVTVGPAAPLVPEGIEAVLAAGAEGSAHTEAPVGEAKPLQIVVTALVHCSALEEPPAPAATPEEEQAPVPAIGVLRVPEPPATEQLASTPEQPPDQLGSPPQLPPQGS